MATLADIFSSAVSSLTGNSPDPLPSGPPDPAVMARMRPDEQSPFNPSMSNAEYMTFLNMQQSARIPQYLSPQKR
jgi:hypothetical protein